VVPDCNPTKTEIRTIGTFVLQTNRAATRAVDQHIFETDTSVQIHEVAGTHTSAVISESHLGNVNRDWPRLTDNKAQADINPGSRVVCHQAVGDLNLLNLINAVGRLNVNASHGSCSIRVPK